MKGAILDRDNNIATNGEKIQMQPPKFPLVQSGTYKKQCPAVVTGGCKVTKVKTVKCTSSSKSGGGW